MIGDKIPHVSPQVIDRAAVMKPTNLNDFIKRYLAGETAQKLSRELSVKGDTFVRWLRDGGIQPRTRAEAQEQRRADTETRLGVSAADLTARYLAGESEKQLADAAGTSRAVIRRRLKDAGVVLRSQSEAESLKWRQRIDPAARLRQVEAAQAARRGMTDSDGVRRARAV